jgi:hypothetical protein
MQVEKSPMWIKGLKINSSEGILYLWSQERLHFNCMKTGKLLSQYKNLTSQEDHITDILVLESYRYFVTSTQFGHLLVRKISSKKG